MNQPLRKALLAMASDPLFLLFDGHAIIYRAFHAFPELTDSQGRMINAVYGFTRIVLTAIRDFEPTYVAVAFDLPQPTFRHEKDVNYKATREEMPDTLKPQIEVIREMVTALNIPQFAVVGYEADDVIGTLATQAAQLDVDGRPLQTTIVTGDRDTLQLVNDRVRVWMPARGKFQTDMEYDADGVVKKMGVAPNLVADLKGLMGDSSDNIPGVSGIGPKTASRLIQEFGDLDALYHRLNAVVAGESDTSGLLTERVVKKLLDERDSAFSSRELATIMTDVPIELELDGCRISGYDKTSVMELFESLGFKSLINLLPADDFEMGVQEALF